MKTFNLLCAPCGQTVAFEGEVTCGTDIMQAAALAGWVCVNDYRSTRLAVFCSDACLSSAVTRRGFLRRDLGYRRNLQPDPAP